MTDDPDVERPDQVEFHVVEGRRTVVTALPLTSATRLELSRLLDARVLDVREPCERPDLVLTPPCSPQLIGALKRKYPGARVVIVELEDWDLDIEFPGPVKRMLRAGADAYLLADSLEELAHKITTANRSGSGGEQVPPGELPVGATIDEVIAAFLRESVQYSTRAHAAPPDPVPRRIREGEDRGSES